MESPYSARLPSSLLRRENRADASFPGSGRQAAGCFRRQPVTTSPTTFEHEPVMLREILEIFSTVPPGIFVDATLGGAGHAKAVLDQRSDLKLVGIDRDPVARAAALEHLSPHHERVTIVAARFDQIRSVLERTAVDEPVTAVLFDLGVSSPQLDIADRGFSYRLDGPLDMRMNSDDPRTAADIVNEWPRGALVQMLRDGADERFAGRIADRIIANRPIASTASLAEIVINAIPAATRRTGGHPAKRTFQAIRIAVNDELEQIEPAINAAIDALVPGGRGAVLTYHSGEDRITKHTIALAETGGCTCPTDLGCACDAVRRVQPILPRFRRASQIEQATNRRSTSARLRCFERLNDKATTS